MGEQSSIVNFFAILSLPVPMGVFEPFVIGIYVEYSTTVL